jgi:hypothetical protein
MTCADTGAASGLALDYLHGRGFTDATIERFQLGYAAGGWDVTARRLIDKRQIRPEELAEVGLTTAGQRGPIDRFRERVMFPIRKSGQAVLVEGYTDALMAHQAVFDNVVASLGTALTPGQVGRALVARRVSRPFRRLRLLAPFAARTRRGSPRARAPRPSADRVQSRRVRRALQPRARRGVRQGLPATRVAP